MDEKTLSQQLQESGWQALSQLTRLGHWYQRAAPAEFRAFAAQWTRRRRP